MAQSRRFFTSRMPIASCAVVVALALAGCQADGAESPTATPEASESASSSSPSSPSATPTPTQTAPEPTPASSEGPAANIPVPEKPALADRNTKAGLEAFTKWWFELLNYGYVTNDWEPLNGVTDPGCRTCQSIKESVGKLYVGGRWVKGAQVEVTNFATKFELTTTESIVSYVTNQQDRIVYFDPDGSVAKTAPQQSEPSTDVVIATFYDGAWVLLDYGKPEGTSE